MKRRLFLLSIMFVLIMTGFTKTQQVKTQLLAADPPVIIIPPVKAPLNIPGKTKLITPVFKPITLFKV